MACCAGWPQWADGGDAKVTGIESSQPKIVIVQHQWNNLFNALFQVGLGPIFFLQTLCGKFKDVQDSLVAALNGIYPNTKMSPPF